LQAKSDKLKEKYNALVPEHKAFLTRKQAASQYTRQVRGYLEPKRQQEIMCGYQVDRIFSEKLSGANTDRPQLRAMLDYVREGDTPYIESISRLGRSTRDLLNIIDTLTDKGVTLISHKENIDTNSPTGKFMLTVFAALSQLSEPAERES